MNGDDQIQSWRDYQKLRPLDDINVLLRRSEDSGWAATRELLARMGWGNLHRVAVISGDILGRGIVYVLLPDETVGCLSSEYGTYETCSVREFADWDVQYAEPLWNTVVWLRYHMKQSREYTEALRESDEPKWRDIRAFVESKGVDPSKSAIEEMIPDQHEEVWYLVAKDRPRFSFDIPYRAPSITNWEERPPDYDRYPYSHQKYEFACWLLDGEEGKTSDWIFTRPYDWWDQIKTGWNPPFGKPTFETAEEAALMMMKKDVVRVASVIPKGERRVEVTLEVDEDPSGQFPMTMTCEQLPNGRWHQVEPQSSE
jgi:hypothetical protein